MDISPTPELEPSLQPLHVLVVELDPVMRAGLITCLTRFPDLRVLGEAETVSQVVSALAVNAAAVHPPNLTSPDGSALEVEAGVEAGVEIGVETGVPTIDVVVSGLPLQVQSEEYSGLFLVQRLRELAMENDASQRIVTPLLLWVERQDPGLISAFELGVPGCCFRGGSLLDLVSGIRRIAQGQTDWPPDVIRTLSSGEFPNPRPISRKQGWRERWRGSALSYIQQAITEIDREIQIPTRSWLQQQILAGRRRELIAAQWLTNQIWAVAGQPVSLEPPVVPINPIQRPDPLPNLGGGSTIAITTLADAPTELTPPKIVQAQLFDRIAQNLQSGLENLTASPLEIDILREDKKRELFYLILRQMEGLLEEVRFSKLSPAQLPSKCDALLHDLWAGVTSDFFGRYLMLPNPSGLPVEVVPVLLSAAGTVKSQILSQIPLIPELLGHLLFQTPFEIDHDPYPVGNPQACDRAVALLENLMIQMANAVMQPLLNQFADAEALKQGFYDRRLLSNREIERFRNDLSWRYRVDQFFLEPKAIFESQYRLMILTPYGIQRISIYAPRGEELANLKGLPWAITLAIETRDALSPRIRSLTSFLGTGVVYLLTEIIGRGIGLVGRGILKGIGTIWQEKYPGRKG